MAREVLDRDDRLLLVLQDYQAVAWARLLRADVALPLLARARADRARRDGEEALEVVWLLHEQGLLLSAIGRYAEAEPLLRRALRISETVRGANHEDTAVLLVELGRLLLDTGRYAEAEPLLRRARAIFVTQFGSDHAYPAVSSSALAALLGATGRRAEADVMFDHAIEVLSRTRDRTYFGPSLVRRGRYRARLGRDAEAAADFTAALAEFEAVGILPTQRWAREAREGLAELGRTVE